MGVAGLFNLGIHPDALTKLLSQNSVTSPTLASAFPIENKEASIGS